MKKNIAILIPQLGGGGAERVASNLSIHLPEDRYNKYVIVYDAKVKDYPYEGDLINLNIEAVSNPLGKIMNSLKRIYRLRKIKNKYKIDTTISLLSSPNIINILSRKNDKVIVSVRNFISKSSNGFYGKLFKLSIKLLYNKADSVVVVSNAMKNDLVENYGVNEDKVKVIYNPYDIGIINSLSEEKIEEEYREIFKGPTIITAGRLSKQKGQWHLIRAFKKVKEEIHDVKLVILGKGELEEYLKKLTVELGLENDIYFLGFQKNPFKYIEKSTVYAFPSLYEGFPNALCEAMACGIPVISSDCKSGPREILAPSTDIKLESKYIEYEKYGILIPACDEKMYEYNEEITKQEEILFRSLVELLQDKNNLKKYSIKAKERVEDFSIENIINMWISQV